MYKIYDSYGYFIKSFSTFEGAMTFKIVNNRLDWEIK